MVGVRVSLPTLNLGPRVINFVIDTGASTTCLHPLDAVLIGIAVDRLERATGWARSETRTGIGGNVRYSVVPAVYGFEDEDGSALVFEQDIRVAQFSSATAELPSLLGWDLLQNFRVSMDRRENDVSLE
jgi:hypothetical protein